MLSILNVNSLFSFILALNELKVNPMKASSREKKPGRILYKNKKMSIMRDININSI